MEWDRFIISSMISMLLCLIVGLYLIWPKNAKNHPWIFSTFYLMMFVVTYVLVSAPFRNWAEFNTDEKFLFTGLAVLAAYTFSRVYRARFNNSKLPEKYINDIGFVLFVVASGFVVASLIYLKVENAEILYYGVPFVGILVWRLVIAVKNKSGVKTSNAIKLF